LPRLDIIVLVVVVFLVVILFCVVVVIVVVVDVVVQIAFDLDRFTTPRLVLRSLHDERICWIGAHHDAGSVVGFALSRAGGGYVVQK